MKDDSHTTILPYQPSWKDKYEMEKANLLKIFGDKLIDIQHIGSTSVEGLKSKPIIDIGVMIKNRTDVDYFLEALNKIGYNFQAQYQSSTAERHFSIKGDPIEYHLSIAYTDQGGFWGRQILFRDYLRSHPDLRGEYSKLKEDLLKADPTGKGSYISGKTVY